MKPFPLYHLFPEHFAALQPPLAETVVKAAAPDFIFLLGASLDHRRSESIFTGPAPSVQHIGDCSLLVLLPHLGGKDVHEWQEKIEAHCLSALLPVTALVVRTGHFEQWLQERDRFALRVLQSAEVIYNSGKRVLSLPEGEAPPLPGEATGKDHAAGLLRAAEFLAGAELFRLRKQYAMAAFMLHQSAEQSLRTLVHTGTGFSPTTHSLERLLRYAALVSFRVHPLFPQQTEKDKRLFRLLQKAYIDTRYNDYTISGQDLVCLTGRVEHLCKVLADVGKQRFSAALVDINR